MAGRPHEHAATSSAMAVLAAAHRRGGRALLGDDLHRAHMAFERSRLGDGHPSCWTEAPLTGEPGFDFHVYYDRPELSPGVRLAPDAGPGHQRTVDWFVGEETGGVGMGFAHDLMAGQAGGVATYVNVNRRPLDNTAGFFEAAGAPALAPAVAGLQERLPADYRTWYLGVFANRAGSPARVGCFLPKRCRLACQDSPAEFGRELARIGFVATSDAMLRQLAELSRVALGWEVQFDVHADGSLGDTLSIDLCTLLDKTVRVREFFAPDAPGAQAMCVLEGWGVADERWRLIPRASLNLIGRPGGLEEDFVLRCYPAFIKAKWKAGVAQPSKVYLVCSARPASSFQHMGSAARRSPAPVALTPTARHPRHQ